MRKKDLPPDEIKAAYRAVFLPEIQLDKKSVETQSDEESFQISLRGRKILFRAVATLGIPVRKNELSTILNNSNNG